MFITIEGIDGSGKSTLAAGLVARLAEGEHRVSLTAEPSWGPTGRIIRRILHGEIARPPTQELARLFASDRRLHLDEEIEPALAAGQVVVCDRYVLSSLVYQSHGAMIDPEVWRLNESFRVPDLTLVVQVEPSVALRRLRERGGPMSIYEHPATLEVLCRRHQDAIRHLREVCGWPIVEIRGAHSTGDVLDEAIDVVASHR